MKAFDIFDESDTLAEELQEVIDLPQIAQMMQALERSGPQQAYDALARFKDNSWKALNSYAHTGIHPIPKVSRWVSNQVAS